MVQAKIRYEEGSYEVRQFKPRQLQFHHHAIALRAIAQFYAAKRFKTHSDHVLSLWRITVFISCTATTMHCPTVTPRARWTLAKCRRVPGCSATGEMTTTAGCPTTGTGRTRQPTDTESWSGRMETGQTGPAFLSVHHLSSVVYYLFYFFFTQFLLQVRRRLGGRFEVKIPQWRSLTLSLSVCVWRQGKGKYTCKASGGKYEGEYKDDKKVGQHSGGRLTSGS